MREDGPMSNRYAVYSKLKIDYPAERILRVTFDRPETYNSVDAETHTQLANIWRDINDDPDVNAVIVTAEQDTGSSPATAAMRGE
jgi:enoyl-CoA hydratase